MAARIVVTEFDSVRTNTTRVQSRMAAGQHHRRTESDGGGTNITLRQSSMARDRESARSAVDFPEARSIKV